MTTIMTASTQWATRPADERFTNLTDLLAHVIERRARSVPRVVSNRHIQVRPVEEDAKRKSLAVTVNGQVSVPTHWAFNQLAGLVNAPAGYLRGLPADIVADCLNYGYQKRGVEEVGTMLVCDPTGGVSELACATGPNYGRIWNEEVIAKIVDRFGNGIDGKFTVPGEFGKPVNVTNANTTLYASDRDCFVFLADEKNRIGVPNRRGGMHGELARGFLVANSEVGSQTLSVATFLFDYVCSNRMIWGAEQHAEIRIRHTAGAPDRWLEEIAPALEAYANAETTSIVEAVDKARRSRFDNVERLDEFLRTRFTKNQVSAIKLSFFNDEGDRPMENLWDVVVGATAMARGLQNQDNRVAVERTGGQDHGACQQVLNFSGRLIFGLAVRPFFARV